MKNIGKNEHFQQVTNNGKIDIYNQIVTLCN